MGIGLDEADQLASVIGALAGVVGLILTIRYARAHGSAAPARKAADRRADRAANRGAHDPAEVAGMVFGMVLSLALLGLCAWGGIVVVRAIGSGSDGADPPTGSSAAASPPASRPAAPETAPVVWRDELRLDGLPKDFDTEPPTRGNFSTDLRSDAYLDGSTYRKYFGGTLALWVEKAAPDRDDCATRIETHGRPAVSIVRGSRVCLRTDRGRIVLLEIGRRDDDAYLATATLWGEG